MPAAFIFHGTEGHPEENWFPWLKAKLQEKGLEVIVPQFPSPPVVAAKINEWFDALKPYEDKITEQTVLVGHSLGGVFALRVLERLTHVAKTTAFVGTPIGERPILNYDRDMSFSGFDFDWPTIKSCAQNFIVFQSDDDPYVSPTNGQQLAKHLGVKLSFVPNAGHFNSKAGFVESPQLLAKLEPVL